MNRKQRIAMFFFLCGVFCPTCVGLLLFGVAATDYHNFKHVAFLLVSSAFAFCCGTFAAVLLKKET